MVFRSLEKALKYRKIKFSEVADKLGKQPNQIGRWVDKWPELNSTVMLEIEKNIPFILAMDNEGFVLIPEEFIQYECRGIDDVRRCAAHRIPVRITYAPVSRTSITRNIINPDYGSSLEKGWLEEKIKAVFPDVSFVFSEKIEDNRTIEQIIDDL